MKATTLKEPNVMHYYFSRYYNNEKNSAVYQLLEGMREASLKGKPLNPSKGLLKDAETEISDKIILLDKSTPIFSNLLNGLVLGRGQKQTIMLIEGYLHNSKDDKDYYTIIPIDLGTNPHQLNKQGAIDAYITQEFSRDFLHQYQKELLRKGFNMFIVKASRLFYFRNKEFESNFYINDSTDFDLLIPFLTLPKNYVPFSRLLVSKGVHDRNKAQENYKKWVADPDVYKDLSIEFTSSRLKQLSMIEKIRYKLLLPLGDLEDVKIDDWAGHRSIVNDKIKVHELESQLAQHPNIKIVHKTDFYKKVKKNKFRNLNLTAEVNGLKKYSEPHVREVQIVDKNQYFRNELTPDDSCHHDQQKKKRSLIRKYKKSLSGNLTEIIRSILPIKEEMVIYI